MAKTKWIPIECSIEIPAEMSFDEFTDKFIDLINENGWHFLGFFEDVEREDKEKAELAKRLEIANSSPFPQGMSQAEYFGLVEEDKP